MEWCAVHKRYCPDIRLCIARAVRLSAGVTVEEVGSAVNKIMRHMNNKDNDLANFIIEKSIVIQPSWHNSRINYRLKQWMPDIGRYEFCGDFFWIGNLRSVLRNEYGIEKPEDVQVVDLTDF